MLQSAVCPLAPLLVSFPPAAVSFAPLAVAPFAHFRFSLSPLSLSPVAVLFAQGEAPPPEAGEAAVSPTCLD